MPTCYIQLTAVVCKIIPHTKHTTVAVRVCQPATGSQLYVDHDEGSVNSRVLHIQV